MGIDIKVYFFNVPIFNHLINHFMTLDSGVSFETHAHKIAGKCTKEVCIFRKATTMTTNLLWGCQKSRSASNLETFSPHYSLFSCFSAEANLKVQISMAKTNLFCPFMLHGSVNFSRQKYLVSIFFPDLLAYFYNFLVYDIDFNCSLKKRIVRRRAQGGLLRRWIWRSATRATATQSAGSTLSPPSFVSHSCDKEPPTLP